jgi:hypothetical protein
MLLIVGDDEHEAVVNRDGEGACVYYGWDFEGLLRIRTLDLRSCLALLAHGKTVNICQLGK